MTLFELCTPRADVLGGHLKESDFAADLAQVLTGRATQEYQDPAIFFANTHPTVGLKRLLDNVCRRLSGAGGEAASIFRLDTQYGGGKTHGLIALTHLARGAATIPNISEFVDPRLAPRGRVRVAAFDGENADPVNGRPLENGIRAYTPWGELAYALAGRDGYERVRASDVERVAPGADTLRELFGGEPALILLDELSIYLRKVQRRPEASQLTPFLTALFKAVESSPGAAMVFTLAIGKTGLATDAYALENQLVVQQLSEAEKVAARKATVLDPTTEDETPQVLRRRLFARIDDLGASQVVAAYRELWAQHAADLPPARLDEDRVGELQNGFPFHPVLMSTLTDKLSTLANFQRVRGMLRLLTQAVGRLWAEHPSATYAIHLHHLDPSFGPTKNEIVTRLELGAFDPAIRNDVAAAKGSSALAQDLDARHYKGLPPYASFVARTILWETFAFNEHLKGATPEEIRLAVLAPGLEPSFVNDARQRFVADSAYLDDRPSAPLRFLTEANLNQIIRRQEEQVDRAESRTQLNDRIRAIFGGPTLGLVPFPGGPYEVGDDVGDGRPKLVVINHDAEAVNAQALQVPALVARIFKEHGSQGQFRQLKNNLVFLVADAATVADAKAKMIRRLALEALRATDRFAELADHQQAKVNELYQRSEQELALAIQQCYRHLFFSTRNSRVEGASLDLGHTAFDITSASEKPGVGQQQVLRALKDNQKLMHENDDPLAPSYVRDLTPLKGGQISTGTLRGEFRKDVRLPMLVGDGNFQKLVRKGIEDSVWVYRTGTLLLGPGDPWAEIKVDEGAILFTMSYASEHGIWPRPKLPDTDHVISPPDPDEPAAVASGGDDSSTVPEPSADPGTRAPMTFTAEAPLRQALAQVWETARGAHVNAIARLELRVFEATDAFRLVSATRAISNTERRVALEGNYETQAGSTMEFMYAGTPEDAEPLKEFLQADLRAAKDKHIEGTFSFAFTTAMSLTGQDAEQLTDKLAAHATGAAFVKAVAEAAP